MTDLQKFQRVARIFLARLLALYGRDAPWQLRQIADEVEQLKRDESGFRP
jgi:hypothetical protein